MSKPKLIHYAPELSRCVCLKEFLASSNVEIVIQLNYSEESSLARDFRKELGYSPTEARQRLVEQSPEALLR